MNRFELFTLIFYALDAVWDESHEEELGKYLSDANPFIFEDIGSAVPAVYDEFCNVIDGDITIENSYDKALSYIHSLDNKQIEEAFAQISRTEWFESVSEYLASEHKGMSAK